MKYNEMYPSKWLKSEDLDGHEPVVTINRVVLENFEDPASGEKSRKPAVFFDGKDKALILNKTNFKAICKISGSEETNDWKGVKIKLGVVEVQAFGDIVQAIRVKAPGGSNPVASRSVQPQTPENSSESGLAEDEIPF